MRLYSEDSGEQGKKRAKNLDRMDNFTKTLVTQTLSSHGRRVALFTKGPYSSL